MKKLLLVLAAVLVLGACGNDNEPKTHKSIDADLAKDTRYILSIYEKADDEKRELTSEEEEAVEDYLAIYDTKASSLTLPSTGNMSKEEVSVITNIDVLQMAYDPNDDLGFKGTIESTNNILETGKASGES